MNTVKLFLFFSLFLLLLSACNLPQAKNSSEDGLLAISFSEPKINIEIGEDKELQIITEPLGLEISTLTLTSSDEGVVTVNDTGLVHAVSNGDAVILAVSSKGLSAMCNVTVAEPSAYDALSNNEKLFFDLFIRHINDFKDPASIRIVGFSICPEEGSDSTSFYVSGNNALGGTIQKHYSMALRNYTSQFGDWEIPYYRGNLDELTIDLGIESDDWCKDVSVQKINSALKEYFVNKGF